MTAARKKLDSVPPWLEVEAPTSNSINQPDIVNYTLHPAVKNCQYNTNENNRETITSDTQTANSDSNNKQTKMLQQVKSMPKAAKTKKNGSIQHKQQNPQQPSQQPAAKRNKTNSKVRVQYPAVAHKH